MGNTDYILAEGHSPDLDYTVTIGGGFLKEATYLQDSSEPRAQQILHCQPWRIVVEEWWSGKHQGTYTGSLDIFLPPLSPAPCSSLLPVHCVFSLGN